MRAKPYKNCSHDLRAYEKMVRKEWETKWKLKKKNFFFSEPPLCTGHNISIHSLQRSARKAFPLGNPLRQPDEEMKIDTLGRLAQVFLLG